MPPRASAIVGSEYVVDGGTVPIVVNDEALEQGVCFVDAGNAGETLLLHHSILERLVGTLDTAFDLGRVGTKDIDVEFVEGAAELRYAFLAAHVRLVDPEHRVLVAVQRYRLAMRLDVGAHRLEIGERALARHELRKHQLTRRVVDKDEQGALRTALLEPPMLAAIDLDQLADTVAAMPRLMKARLAIAARDPDAIRHHPLPKRLDADWQTMLCQSAFKRDPLWRLIGVQKGTTFGAAVKLARQSR